MRRARDEASPSSGARDAHRPNRPSGILRPVGVRGRQRRDARTRRPGSIAPPDRRERVEQLADEVRDENPDPTTRREAFELDLMDEDLVDEGRDVQVTDAEDHHT
jgi:hypothetical protein